MSYAKEMLEDSPGHTPVDGVLISSCIEACFDCEQACADACRRCESACKDLLDALNAI